MEKKEKTPEEEFLDAKVEYMKIAKDLCYPKSVLRKIRAATSENEISIIMSRARLST